MKSRTIVKLPVASRIAREMSAEPPTTARRNQGGIVPPPTDGPPSAPTVSAGSNAAAGFSSRWSLTTLLLDVRPGDDQPGDHVDDEGDPEEHEAGRDQRVDVDARGLGELEGDVGRDRSGVLLADQVERDDPRDREDDRHGHRLPQGAAESEHRPADHR